MIYMFLFLDCSCQSNNDLKIRSVFRDNLFDRSISNESKSLMIYDLSMNYLYQRNNELINIELDILLSTKLSNLYFYYLFRKKFDIFLKNITRSELSIFEKDRLIRLLLLLSVDDANPGNNYRSLALSLHQELLNLEIDSINSIELFNNNDADVNTKEIDEHLNFYLKSIFNSMNFMDLDIIRDKILHKYI